MPMYDALPRDPVMLLSFANTQLRDNFSTLDSFCGHFQVERSVLEARLASIDYAYDENTNQFV